MVDAILATQPEMVTGDGGDCMRTSRPVTEDPIIYRTFQHVGTRSTKSNKDDIMEKAGIESTSLNSGVWTAI
jgi:hypothetical protein